MQNEVCISCQRPKATLNCGVCLADLCKSCAEYLDASSFPFLQKIPEELTHTYYCSDCHSVHVIPARESYEEVLARARETYFFFATQKRPPPILKKSKETVRVASCTDRDETILRLAFMAVEQGYNAVILAEVTSEKVRNGGFVKAIWKGMGVPATVDAEKLERRSESYP